MLGQGLLKVLSSAKNSNTLKLADDPDIANDYKHIHESLTKNYRDLSTFDRWVAELNSGILHWGITHTDKFWRENAKFIEQNDFALLKNLIALAETLYRKGQQIQSDPVSLCVALNDIGEFTRFYPNGRIIVAKLGGKVRV